MERYDSYKDSGVQWLGEIPSHWEVNKFKNLYNTRTGITFTKAQLEESGEPVISYGQIHSKENKYSSVNPVLIRHIPSTLTEGSSGALAVNGDFLFADTSEDFEGCGNCVYVDTDYPIYAGYHTILAKKNNIECGQYFAYLFACQSWRGQVRSMVNGVKVYSITQTILKNTTIILPPISEQQAIASYLDEATSKIDAAIAQQQKMIDLLNERKQIIINNAVTKGLNPNVKMKDSGVDWIGEIPEHWEVRKLKHIAKLKSGDTISSDSFTEDGYPVYGGNGFRGYTNRFTNDGEYVLIGRQGALCGNVNYALGKFFASEHAVVVYPYANENTTWVGEVIRASNLNQYSQSAAQPGLAVSVIENIAYPYPPGEERTAIAEYLMQQMNAINAALHNIERQILLLQERKQIIINDVVTGKVKVTK